MSAILPQDLPSHQFFEDLLSRNRLDNVPEAPYGAEADRLLKINAHRERITPLVIVYFTAKWCGACKRLDIPTLCQIRRDAMWYKCDIDDNTYTPGYCGVRTIPSFQAIVNGKAVPLLASSDNAVVANWLSKL